MDKKYLKFLGLMTIFVFLLSACANGNGDELSASGTFSAIDTSIISEINGKVIEVKVKEGDQVTAGQTLVMLDAEFSQVQFDQASAAVEAAEAAVEASKQQAESADAQYQLALYGAVMENQPARLNRWQASIPEDYQPAWYFNSSEMIDASQSQVDQAEKALLTALSDLENEQKKTSSKDFIAAEDRLALAQASLSVAEKTLMQAQASNNESLEDAAMELKDSARAEFDAALSEYQRMLTTSAADAIIMARSRVAVAQAALDNARDELLILQTGDQSLQVTATRKAAEAAESMVTQAEAGLEQAKQAKNLAQLQLDRATIKSPVDGVVLTRNVDIGDLAMAGGMLMRIGQLDRLDLIVYLPEDEYGVVDIGDSVLITVDSFPNEVFDGTVLRISDEAQFTPKNVQTEAGRKSTVYAVKIQVENLEHKLKPGMPADVTFNIR